MKLIVARHGATDWNAVDRLQGNIDIPLSAVGQVQAQRLADSLANEPVDVIYASGLQRAQATAQPVVS
jgi:broad specificity phosphatase PhoE